ncbi:acyl-CoA dehydrogenase family protein [Pseudomonas sp. TTU2014-080ASC]|uniref:acyl-CoA dehydrogenase family protein n=1 Tax=Pseudomonas sp. TTU2014-080ASC TaxID=1729724 RepID=UPI000718A5D4|nr:acyl-CoA dehydrogenase family protein [Pseudomonas sp. TTU2014-080ASC]KRW62909.1 acyl-CoA dehydrogenase [Pseudomonas sp. TTU2014-080ASC]
MLNTQLRHWLDQHAEALDLGQLDAAEVLPQLAAADLLRVGVPAELGGNGGTTQDAIAAVVQVASHSLTSAFVLWGQRSFIEFLLHSENRELAQRLLSPLLSGELAGASGLSNAMKHLSGIEQLGVQAAEQGGDFILNGRLPWVTNLRKQGFVVAAAVERADAPAFIAAIDSNLAGLSRSDDLQLLGMQSSNTAAVQLQAVKLPAADVIATDARAFLGRVRPCFLGLQCAMALGLAQRSVAEIEAHLGGSRSVLQKELDELRSDLRVIEKTLNEGLCGQAFVGQPKRLFELRIALAKLTSDAVQLELQASGGRAYLQPYGAGFARRWRESAFIPVITPSLVQLRAELEKAA